MNYEDVHGTNRNVILTQSVDITGCAPYGVGALTATVDYQTRNDDTAGMEILFEDTGTDGPMIANQASTSDWAVSPMSIGGSIPADETSALLSLIGTDGGTGGPADRARVYLDDANFATDCAVEYAKVSGKIAVESSAKRGTRSFSGAIGTLESGDLAGSITINYKDERVTCDFTPMVAGVDIDGVAATAELTTEYLCDDVPASEGEADINLVQGDGGSEGRTKNPSKRGTIEVIVTSTSGAGVLDGDELDIGPEPETLLKGNVKVAELD